MGIQAKKIWDIDSITKADGCPPDPLPSGEIHPDLIRYKGYWYCGLKECPHAAKIADAKSCKAGDRSCGGSRIIRSADGKNWESVKFIKWSAGRVTDLKFSITGEGALMVNTMVTNSAQHHFNTPCRPEQPESGPVKRMSVTWLTTDGLDWGTMYGCPTGIHTTRYMTTWHEGMGYSLAYCQKDERGTLYRTHDGKSWQVIARHVYDSWTGRELAAENMPADDQRLKYVVLVENKRRLGVDVNNLALTDSRGGFTPKPPSEAALAFQPDGTMVALARAHPVYAIMGTAPAPFYDQWTWRETRVDWAGDGKLRPAGELLGVQMGGPVLLRLSDGRLIAAGRADASTENEGIGRLTLFEVDVENAVLKRFGDFDGWSHYPGVVEHEGKLWITCGKQQRPNLFGVYLLQTDLPGGK